MANNFIDGVVTTYIFSQALQLTGQVKEPGGVKPAGMAKDGLGGAQARGQLIDDGRVDTQVSWPKGRGRE
jgi:hypothetical protein